MQEDDESAEFARTAVRPSVRRKMQTSPQQRGTGLPRMSRGTRKIANVMSRNAVVASVGRTAGRAGGNCTAFERAGIMTTMQATTGRARSEPHLPDGYIAFPFCGAQMSACP